MRAETTGQLADALAAYIEATDADPRGVEPWTRRAAVACRLERFKEADAFFSEAAGRDESFEPLWRERALCALARSDMQGALAASARAESLDPDREEAVLLRSNVLERVGDNAAAVREIVGLTTRRPSPTAWKRQLGIAERAGDEPAARLARQALARHPEGPDPTAPKAAPPSLADVDRALSAGEFSAAEQLGRRVKLAPGVLVVRAVALGRTEMGSAQAMRVFGADPASSDAFIAAIAASEIRLDMKGVERLLDRTRATTLDPPSYLATLLLLDLLVRRVGPEAAFDPGGPMNRADPLEERLRVGLAASAKPKTSQ